MRRNFLTTIIALLVFVSVSANIPEYHSVKAVSAIKSDGTQTAVTSEETAFGRRLLERWKKAGVKLPMSEEKIKSLRPGKKSSMQSLRWSLTRALVLPVFYNIQE